MTHIEVLDSVLKNHGTNYRQISLAKGKPEEYYYIQFNYRAKNISVYLYADVMSHLGARILVVTGKKKTDITEMLLADQTKTALSMAISLYAAVGATIVVSDSGNEYPVTSGVINEETKVRGRKRGRTPGGDAVAHGDGAV